MCYISCKSFTGKLAILILFKKLSPVFSCRVTSLIYLSMYTCINTLNSFSCICNFNLVSTYLTKPLPHVQIHPNLMKYAFYTYFAHYADNFTYYAGIMLNAFAILLYSKLCWHIRLKPNSHFWKENNEFLSHSMSICTT